MTAFDYVAAGASTVSAIGVLFTIVSKRRSRAGKELVEAMTLWVVDGGGAHIRKIVNEENQAIMRRLDEHELTEPERFRQAWRDMRAETEEG